MKKTILLMSGLLLLPLGEAKAVSDNALQRQIDNLREDLQVMQREMYRSKGDAATGSAQDVVVKLGEMDENLRDMVGKIDMIEYKIKTLEEKIEVINKDVDVRLKMMEEKIEVINKDVDVRLKMIEGKPIEDSGMGTNAPAKKFDAPVAQGAPAAVVGGAIAKGDDLPQVNTKTAEQIYQEGLDAINAGKNDEAADRFTAVLTKFPEHKLAANAQYWLGESYYGKKDYAKAAVAFAKGYEKYKDGNKGADNILKLGMSMQMLGKKDEACTAFVNLPKEFPNAAANLKDKASKMAKELECKE